MEETMEEQEETETPKLEWMYKSSAHSVDTEEYLLGRKIDRAFETHSGFNDVDKDILPASIFANAKSNIQVDIIRKVKEDPLEQIKQKEIEMRRQLLKNPVKMKKLQNMLMAREAEMKKIKKKSKKHKKESIDDLITEKYSKLMKKLGAKTMEELMDKIDEVPDESDDDKPKKKKRKNDSDDEKHKRKTKKYVDSSEDEKYKRKKKKYVDSSEDEKYKRENKKYGDSSEDEKYKSRSRNDRNRRDYRDRSRRHESPKTHRKYETPYRNKERSPSPKPQKTYNSSDDEQPKKSYGLIMPGGKPVPVKKHDRRDESAKREEVKPAPKQIYKPKKLSEKEKEARLREMMINAKWRDETRKQNVQKYREEDKKESNKNDREYDTEFVSKQLSIATSDASIAQRIKSNINNIQRSGFAMDKHFAKRC